jgi:predicted Fe-S protein YdhL (DUF1289 family)
LYGFEATRHISAMLSPCRKICVHDPSRDICAGCGRTLAEIENWLEMSEEERRAVMEKLPERLKPLPAS